LTENEKAVGVYVNPTITPCSQCKRPSEKAEAVLAQITKIFHYRDKHTLLRLYKQQMRPRPEIASPAWSPWLTGDIKDLERDQRALRMTTVLKGNT
jgi:hypothetical protein